MSKVDRGVKSPSHLGVLTKFSAIVLRDRMHRSLVRPKALVHRRQDRGSGLVRNALGHRILRAAFDQGHESSSMAMPDHGIALPVTNSLASGHETAGRSSMETWFAICPRRRYVPSRFRRAF